MRIKRFGACSGFSLGQPKRWVGRRQRQHFDIESGRYRVSACRRSSHYFEHCESSSPSPQTGTNTAYLPSRPPRLSVWCEKPNLADEMHILRPVHVIGGGLAGSEAAWQLARRGVPVVLHEMRPLRSTAVHKTGQFAELVCSNSFRSDDAETSAIGLLHAEMRRLDSLVMRAADLNKLPAGSALAVDRDGFAAAVTAPLQAEPLIEIDRA